MLNRLCCCSVSGASEVQLHIPQGFSESDEEDELYEDYIHAIIIGDVS